MRTLGYVIWLIGCASLNLSVFSAARSAEPQGSLIPSQHSSGGWSKSFDETRWVHTAHYQAPGSLSDGLPVLPAGNFRGVGDAGYAASPQLPTNSYPLSTPSSVSSGFPSGSLPPALPPAPSSSNSTAQSFTPSSSLPGSQSVPTTAATQGFPGMGAPVNAVPGGNAMSSSSRNAVPARPAAYPNAASQSTAASASSGSRISPSQFSAAQISPAQYSVPSNRNSASAPHSAAGNELRSIDDRVTSDGRWNPEGIATGLPFVTPPPRGNYATRPYNHALFQNAAYQREASLRTPQSAGQSGTATQTMGQLTSGAVGFQSQQFPQAVLPPTAQPGIYPTGYQGVYQPALPTPSGVASAGTVPATYAPPTYTASAAPALYASDNAGCKPLFTLGQENYNVQLGRGIIGQPTVYVPSQPFRNFLRYLFP